MMDLSISTKGEDPGQWMELAADRTEWRQFDDDPDELVDVDGGAPAPRSVPEIAGKPLSQLHEGDVPSAPTRP